MYAFFANNAYALINRYNSKQFELKQWDDKQFALATQKSNLQMEQSADRIRFASQKSKLYEELGGISTEDTDSYDAKKQEITALEAKETALNEESSMRINSLAPLENIYEMMKKECETEVTKIGKEMETNDKAIANGIDHANPNIVGLSA